MSNAADVTAINFDQEVLNSDKPVLVDFWAEWCGPCRMIAPSVDEIAGEYTGRLKVMKVDIDQEASIAARYGVMSIPTLILFKGGKVAEQIIGALPKQKIVEKITPHLT
ncbi:MAG: thioredoxin [Armatimonadota bacterium]